MRLLCLHGRGTNSDIFEAQLTPLISRLPKHYEFDFIDAPVPVNPAPGIGGLIEGPYLAWYRRHFTTHVAAAHDYITETIEECGPYDGVVGFSQGAAIATSFMLAHRHENPDAECPFGFAIFLCGVLPISSSRDQGTNCTPDSLEYEREFQDFFGITNEELDAGAGDEVVHTFDPILSNGKREFVSAETRIDIPVLHVVGEADKFSSFSKYIASMCDSDKSTLHYHPGGHELPKADSGMDKVAELFESTVDMFRNDR